MTAKMPPLVPNLTQFALGFAVVSDACVCGLPGRHRTFQSALRFAVVSDTAYWENGKIHMFQSALRFAVVSDYTYYIPRPGGHVSIRFKVRGGFRPDHRAEAF